MVLSVYVHSANEESIVTLSYDTSDALNISSLDTRDHFF